SFARLTGTVSTANRGGFIQFRRQLDAPVPADTGGIRLVVRGNGERYFIHLRTTGTLLPWQFYQSGFEAPGTWTEVRLPLSSFRASGSLLRATPSASTLTSVGVVAYGRDHEALLDVREIGFY
ncbi:CIA30 family protein, partial [Ruegeria aquimaris]